MTEKEIYEFLNGTKLYVGGRSREVQEKLFKLGYSWLSNGKQVQFNERPFIYINDYNLTYGSDMNLFMYNEEREITVDEILQIEVTPPKYRPFKDKNECWAEMLNHEPFGWVYHKNRNSHEHITAIYHPSVFVKNTSVLYEIAFDNYVFMDGTPFGVKEE